MLNKLVSPLSWCNDDAVRETTKEERFSEHLFRIHVHKLQTQVLVIAVKTVGVFLERCFFFVEFCGGTAMCACSWWWVGLRAEELILLFQPLSSFQVMPCCISPSGELVKTTLQNNVEVWLSKKIIFFKTHCLYWPGVILQAWWWLLFP